MLGKAAPCDSDDPPYIEHLGDHWGDLCATPKLASAWVDQLRPILLSVLRERKRGTYAFFPGTTLCYSALFSAGRHDKLLDHLIGSTPGEPGKWFATATAKTLKQFDRATQLAWFGHCTAYKGRELTKTFTPMGLLALITVGTGARAAHEEGGLAPCEFTFEMRLRPMGFDRDEARHGLRSPGIRPQREGCFLVPRHRAFGLPNVTPR